MAVTVNQRAASLEAPPFSYKITSTARGERIVIKPDRTRAGGLGVASFIWHIGPSSSASFAIDVMIGGDWVTDDRVPVGMIGSKVHHHDTPFEALRFTHVTKGSGDMVLRVCSEWMLQIGEG